MAARTRYQALGTIAFILLMSVLFYRLHNHSDISIVSEKDKSIRSNPGDEVGRQASSLLRQNSSISWQSIPSYIAALSEYSYRSLDRLHTDSNQSSEPIMPSQSALKGPTASSEKFNQNNAQVPENSHRLGKTSVVKHTKDKSMSNSKKSVSKSDKKAVDKDEGSKGQDSIKSRGNLNALFPFCLDSSYNLCRPTPNVFIPHIYDMMKQYSPHDIIAFNGRTVKTIFDPSDIKYGVSLTGKSHINRWSQVAALINKSYDLQRQQSHLESTNPKKPRNAAVHLHNEMKFGDFLEYIIKEFRFRHKRNPKTREEFIEAFDLGQPPIVMTNSVDENWGFLSTPINTRTTKWINMTNHLLIHGADYDTVQHLLSSEKLILMVISNHVDPHIGVHEKLIGLPLGLSKKGVLYNKIMELGSKGINKTRLLLINNSGWRERSIINDQISRIFQNKITNSYNVKLSQSRFYDEIARSLFVLAPSGLGFDTYRLWESILLGAIPIVESNAGFDRTYSHLPVLVVSNYSDVTPRMLLKASECFYRNAHRFEYSHLVGSYWINMTSKAVETGSIDHVTSHHHYANPYCRFVP